jgi:hypothetical protein
VRSTRTKRHPIFDYLDRIGVNISSSVPLVVATHALIASLVYQACSALPYPVFVCGSFPLQ